MMRFHNLLTPALLLAGLFVVADSADAAIMYGDFSDIPPGAVIYQDVSESSFTNPVPPPLYGAPSVTGNLLDFDPSGFGVSASGGAANTVDGQLNFTVKALPGAGITSFAIIESGDFSFSGILPAPGTFVSASAGATVTILEVDGVALPGPIAVFASDLFVTDYPTTGGAPVTGLLPWSLATSVDLASAIPFPFVSGATLFEVAINNQLQATTAVLGHQAAIAKKDFKIVVIGDLEPNMIPEPSSFALLAVAGLAIATVRRVATRG